MLVSLRRGYGDLVTSGGQIILLIIGFQTESRLGMFVCVALMAPLSLIAWISAWRRARAVADTPTSRIASAAQGYAELIGIGKPLGGQPVISPANHLPCLWYRYRIEHRDSDNKWTLESQGESEASFILDDGSGECLVDPVGAEMLVSRKDQWTLGERRFTQWLFIEGQKVYVLGQFATLGSVAIELNAGEDVKHLLAEWKTRPGELLQRFDLNQDGRIDLEEWGLARLQAKREVAASHRELHNSSELHVMQRPEDGRFYLISDIDPGKLATKYRWWSWFHVVVFFGALIALPLVWRLAPF